MTGMSPMRNLKKRNVNKGVPLFHRCLKELKKSIKERFDEILSEKEEVEEIMEGSELLLNDLVIVKDRMTPCFPSHYNVFNFYKEIYISKVSEAISPFIPKSSAEAAKDPRILVILASWVDNCQILLEKIGIQDSEDQLILLKSVSLQFNNILLENQGIYSRISRLYRKIIRRLVSSRSK